MRRLLSLVTTLFAFLILSTATAESTIIIPKPPVLHAKAYLLMDSMSGAVIAADNPNEHLPPASLTKLMTLYLTFKALASGSIHLDDKVHVSKLAWQATGSRMFLKVGTDVTVNELIQGVIVDSGNDACIALAEYIAGSESSFVDMMNAQATALGMSNTHYMDSNGLNEPNHYSTAQDLGMLTRALITTFPENYHYFNQRWFTYNNIKQPNRNRLLWRYPSADGLKTGHTSQAGYCLVGSAQKDGMRLIAVVLGEPDDNARTEDSAALLTYGFRFFVTRPLVAAGEIVQTVRVYSALDTQLAVGVKDPLYVTVPEGQLANIKKTITFTEKEIQAPVKKGQILGSITITLVDKPMVQAPLVALNDDPVGGLWRRLCDHVSLGFSHFFGGHSTEDKTTANASAT